MPRIPASRRFKHKKRTREYRDRRKNPTEDAAANVEGEANIVVPSTDQPSCSSADTSGTGDAIHEEIAANVCPSDLLASSFAVPNERPVSALSVSLSMSIDSESTRSSVFSPDICSPSECSSPQCGMQWPDSTLQTPLSVSVDDSGASHQSLLTDMSGRSSALSDSSANSVLLSPTLGSVSVGSQVQHEVLPPAERAILLQEVLDKVKLFLIPNWICAISEDTLNVMCLSRKKEKAVQRRIGVTYDGYLSISVHGMPIDTAPFVKDLHFPGVLVKDNVCSYTDFLVTVTNRVRLMEICSGADHQELKAAWSSLTNAYIDKDFFKECRYEETLRVNSCKLLVDPLRWRCDECNKTVDNLKKRMPSLLKEEADPCTKNDYLSEGQKMKKIEKLTKKSDSQRKKIDRLQEKLALLIKKEGMLVDDETGELMLAAVRDQNLTQHEELFLQQQLKAHSKKAKCGMRWHPHMIRFALSIFMASPAAYNIIVDSGLMRLPHQRTLFDYSHVFEATEGISEPVLKSVCEKLEKKPQQKYKWHVLMCDEMHISKNIVYHKRSGNVMGYAKLMPVEKAMQELKNFLDNVEDTEPAIATKVLSFMIRGVCTNVKEVVASFSIDTLNKEKMFSLTWHLISTLERCGIQIICMTSDGNAVNRAFFKMNTPFTKTKSGVVFDTINKAAPSRRLYFISDVPHLIKTMRNNFYNSRFGPKSKRCLTKNGQPILWSTIIRLFNAKKNKVLRKSYKLNHANVYPDSYTCMRVKYAFQVLSKTVGLDIQAQGWHNTEETVNFILKVNDFADCLNGAHTNSGHRTQNHLLDPYRSPDDERFTKYLLPFLDYLEEWKQEAVSLGNVTQSFAAGDDSFHSLHDIHETDGATENVTPAHKRTLCHQTLEGIEITVRGFMGAVQYLLTEGGVNYVNARIFCQDPLEQFFSKQRAKGGSSNAPNLVKFNENARAIHIQRELGARKRKGNTEVDNSPAQICDEKLPRRKRGCFKLD